MQAPPAATRAAFGSDSAPFSCRKISAGAEPRGRGAARGAPGGAAAEAAPSVLSGAAAGAGAALPEAEIPVRAREGAAGAAAAAQPHAGEDLVPEPALQEQEAAAGAEPGAGAARGVPAHGGGAGAGEGWQTLPGASRGFSSSLWDSRSFLLRFLLRRGFGGGVRAGMSRGVPKCHPRPCPAPAPGGASGNRRWELELSREKAPGELQRRILMDTGAISKGFQRDNPSSSPGTERGTRPPQRGDFGHPTIVNYLLLNAIIWGLALPAPPGCHRALAFPSSG